MADIGLAREGRAYCLISLSWFGAGWQRTTGLGHANPSGNQHFSPAPIFNFCAVMPTASPRRAPCFSGLSHWPEKPRPSGADQRSAGAGDDVSDMRSASRRSVAGTATPGALRRATLTVT